MKGGFQEQMAVKIDLELFVETANSCTNGSLVLERLRLAPREITKHVFDEIIKNINDEHSTHGVQD